MNEIKEDEVLAFRYWPIGDGTKYFKGDLNNEEKVEIIFDYAQILEVGITKIGWEFLIKTYGFEKLYDIDKKSGWFDCETLEEYKQYVKEEMSYGL